jgi:apolipoprotein N-acyltransferase
VGEPGSSPRPSPLAQDAARDRTKHRARLAAVLAALSLGAVHALAFAPWPAWWLHLASLAAGLRLAMAAVPHGQRAVFGLAWAFAMGHFVAGLCWLHVSMHDHGGMPWLLAALALLAFCAYLALFPAVACALALRPRPGIAIAAVCGAWTLAELARGWLFTGFPWLALGYAHLDGPLAAIAPLLGVHGVGMAAVGIAAIAAQATLAGMNRRQRATRVVLAAVLLAGCVPLAMLEFARPVGEPLSVRLVQGNVAQSLKFEPGAAMAAMRAYARHVVESRAALTVLPETAWVTPWSTTPPAIREPIVAALRERGGTLALGVPLVDRLADGSLRITNSVLLLDGRSEAGRYDKQHLVPFGEFVPWGFAWFVRMMQIPLGSFARGGPTQAPFEVGGLRLAANICYEDLFGGEIAAAVRDPVSAGVLVNVSNIAWFGDSHALPQHLEISRMRALETGRPMLRATNTGVTASIDHRGRVLDRLPGQREAVLDTRVQATTGTTPFVAAGEAPIAALAAALVIGAAIAARAGRNRPIQ